MTLRRSLDDGESPVGVATPEPNAAAQTLERTDVDALFAPERDALRRGGALRAAASAGWIGQAALLAWALSSAAVGSLSAFAIVAAGFGYLAIGALRAALDARAAVVLGAAADAAISRARARVAERAAAGAPNDPGRMEIGRVAALGADMVEALEPFATAYAPAKLKLSVTPFLALAAIAAVSWLAAVILALLAALTPFLMAMIGRATRDAADKRLVEVGDMTALLVDRLRVAPDLRLLGAADRAARAFDAAAERVRRGAMAVLRIAFLSSAALEVCASLGIAATAIYVGASLSGATTFGGWGGTLGFGEGVFLLLMAVEFFAPFREFAGAYHERAGAVAFAKALDAYERRAAPALLGRGAVAEPLRPAHADAPLIRLVGAGLAAQGPRLFEDGAEAPPQRWALPPMSLEIAQGESVALVGPSGVGKSTALSLMAGLTRPTTGRVEVLGRALDDTIADAWRARLAWIGQKPHFLAASLRANVAFYRPDAATDDAALAAALNVAGATDVAARAPRGALTPLGETGAGVSGGEGRRLAVARLAFAERSLILADEPTADLDVETARTTADGLMRLRDAGAALVVATHDEALAGRCGRVLRLARSPGPAADVTAFSEAAS